MRKIVKDGHGFKLTSCTTFFLSFLNAYLKVKIQDDSLFPLGNTADTNILRHGWQIAFWAPVWEQNFTQTLYLQWKVYTAEKYTFGNFPRKKIKFFQTHQNLSLLGFTPCKAEQPLLGRELQEKEEEAYRKAV